MNSLKSLFLFYTFLFSFNLFAQNKSNSLYGTVQDTINKTFVNNVEIEIIRGFKTIESIKSDSLGRFRIENIHSGKNEIRFSKTGLVPLHRFFNINAGENELNIFLEANYFELASNEIIYNKDANLGRICSNAKIISNNDITLRNPLTLQELLDPIAGINTFSDGTGSFSSLSIGVRGIHPRQSQQILILEDGIPIQSSPYLMSMGMFYSTPVERIKKIELLKSASALRYGAQGIGGVINFITKNPREDLGGIIRLQGGMNGFGSAYAEVGGFGTKKIKPEIQLLYKRGDGFRDNNNFNQFNSSFKLSYIPSINKKLDVNVTGNFLESNSTYTGLTEYAFENIPNFNSKDNDILKNWNIGANLSYQFEVAKKIQSETKVYLNYTNFQWWQEDNIYVSQANFDINYLKEQSIEQSYTISDLLRVGNGKSNKGDIQEHITAGVEQSFNCFHILGANAKGKFNIGIRLHTENINQQEKIGNNPNDYTGSFYEFDTSIQQDIQIGNHYQWENYALSLFAIEEFRLGKFSVNVGGRLEVFNTERVDILSIDRNRLNKLFVSFLPGIAINYDFKAFDIYVGVHRAFSPPTSKILSTTNFGNTTGSIYEDLNSLTSDSWNFELGARTFSKYINFEATAFLIQIENISTAGHKVYFINESNAISTGIETDINLKASKIFKHLPNIRLNYTFLRTNILKGNLSRDAFNLNNYPDLTGNELPYAPRHSFAISATYHSNFGLSAFIEYRYIGRSYSDFQNVNFIFNRGETGPIPAYWLLNASISYQHKHFLRFFLCGQNLLDNIYISSRMHSHPSYPSASSSSGILVGNRLSIIGGVEYKF